MSGYDVIVVTTMEFVGHSVLRKLGRELGAKVEVRGISDPGLNIFKQNVVGLIRRQLAHRRFFQRAYEGISRDQVVPGVVVPYLDHCPHAIAIFGSPFATTPWIGVVMRSTFHFSKMGIAARQGRMPSVASWFFRRLLSESNLSMLLSIDETLCEYVSRTSPEIGKRLNFLPDPSEIQGDVSRRKARGDLGLSDENFVLLVYGGINFRKGIVQLITAALSDSEDANIRVVLAGRHDNAAKAFLNRPEIQAFCHSGRLQSHDRFISDPEEYSMFQAADAVWLGYRGHSVMSGVMVQAGHMKKPTIACRQGLIGWITQQNASGLVIDIDDPGAIRNAIGSLAHDPNRARELGENGYRRFSKHTAKVFSKTIADSLHVISDLG